MCNFFWEMFLTPLYFNCILRVAYDPKQSRTIISVLINFVLGSSETAENCVSGLDCLGSCRIAFMLAFRRSLDWLQGYSVTNQVLGLVIGIHCNKPGPWIGYRGTLKVVSMTLQPFLFIGTNFSEVCTRKSCHSLDWFIINALDIGNVIIMSMFSSLLLLLRVSELTPQPTSSKAL